MDKIRNMENIMKFEQLLSEVTRPGAENLLNFIRQSDFYAAPASTQYHLAEEGGLLQHSLHVYECLNAKLESPMWKKYLEGVSRETVIVCSLLHDLCKIWYYEQDYKNQKTYDPEKVAAAQPGQVKSDQKGKFIWETVRCYKVEDKYPLGHGNKSVIFILQNMGLTMEEITAITFHMGAYCDSSQWKDLGNAYEKYPLVLALHEADLEATYLMEK